VNHSRHQTKGRHNSSSQEKEEIFEKKKGW
jgi:hypothetical protein